MIFFSKFKFSQTYGDNLMLPKGGNIFEGLISRFYHGKVN